VLLFGPLTTLFATTISSEPIHCHCLQIVGALQERGLRPRKNNWFPVTRSTLILTPDPTKFFVIFPTKKKMEAQAKKKTTITSYQSIITVTDIFHDIHLPVDKTSIVK
jgi:hypothetical protein